MRLLCLFEEVEDLEVDFGREFKELKSRGF